MKNSKIESNIVIEWLLGIFISIMLFLMFFTPFNESKIITPENFTNQNKSDEKSE